MTDENAEGYIAGALPPEATEAIGSAVDWVGEKAGDLADSVGIYAAEGVLGALTGGASVAAEKAIKDTYGYDIHKEATEGYKYLGEEAGSAAYNATSEETHQAALAHGDAAGEAW